MSTQFGGNVQVGGNLAVGGLVVYGTASNGSLDTLIVNNALTISGVELSLSGTSLNVSSDFLTAFTVCGQPVGGGVSWATFSASDVNFLTNSITNISGITAASNLTLGVPTGSILDVQVNGESKVSVAGTKFTVNTGYIDLSGVPFNAYATSNILAIGVGASYEPTTTNAIIIGPDAGREGSAASSYSVYIGVSAGFGNGAASNVAIGGNALHTTSNAPSCIAIGINSLSGSSGQGNNIGIGTNAGEGLTSAGNIAIGSNSLSGANALNIGIGANAGAGATTSNSIFIGTNPDTSVRAGTDYAVGGSNIFEVYSSTVTAARTFLYGDRGTNQLAIGTHDLSGTAALTVSGDVVVSGSLYTASSSVYIGDLKLSQTGTGLSVADSNIVASKGKYNFSGNSFPVDNELTFDSDANSIKVVATNTGLSYGVVWSGFGISSGVYATVLQTSISVTDAAPTFVLTFTSNGDMGSLLFLNETTQKMYRVNAFANDVGAQTATLAVERLV